MACVALLALAARQLDLIGRGSSEYAERLRARRGQAPSRRIWRFWVRNIWACLATKTVRAAEGNDEVGGAAVESGDSDVDS